MRTARFDQPIVSGAILVKHQIFAQDSYLESVSLLHLGDRGYRMPIAAKQFAHRSSGSHSSELCILFLSQHGFLALSQILGSRRSIAALRSKRSIRLRIVQRLERLERLNAQPEVNLRSAGMPATRADACRSGQFLRAWIVIENTMVKVGGP